MCSFGVCFLYTNVPLEETIEICCDVLFRSSFPKPTFPESVFKHLINFSLVWFLRLMAYKLFLGYLMPKLFS